MEYEEIEKRLNNGELLYCPDCYLWESDINSDNINDGTCFMIICDDPFIGPIFGEENNNMRKMEEFFKKDSKNKKMVNSNEVNIY